MRQWWLVIGFWLWALTGFAAGMEVVSFAPVDDIDARQTQVRDNRGELCALVKVQIPLNGVVFEGSMVFRVENRNGEYWVWLPRQAREFTVKHSHLTPLTYVFPQKLLSGTSYRMQVEVPESIVLLDYQSSLSGKSESPVWLTVQYGCDFARQHSWGILFGQRFGAWGYMVDFRSNFASPPDDLGMVADEQGLVDGVRPFYNGRMRSCLLTASAGLVFDCLTGRYQQSMCAVYAGVGYGGYRQWWGTYSGQWVKYGPACVQSVSTSLGWIGAYRGFTASLGVRSFGFRYVEMELGLGYTWKARQRSVGPKNEKKRKVDQ
ncbi:MAG: hypothetical protein J6Y77_05330 [Paludibacteraceae bacterium]|nr:hypothetical protein [Paludibacteraceae bacterium]